MRRLVQLLSLLMLATSGVMLVGSFNGAQATGSFKAEPTALQAAWYWKNLYATVNPPIGEAPPSASEPSGVPDGDLPVAHASTDATSSKSSYVAFDLGSAAVPGTTIGEFTVTLTVDSGNPQAANAGTPAIAACLPTRLWSAVQGGSSDDAPPVDCSQIAKPKVDGDKYTFDITPIAQSWIDDQNIGVAFVNDPDNTQTPYQVVFTGAKTIKASMVYTPPAAASSGSTGGTTSGTATSVTTGSTGSSASGPVSVPPVPATTSDTTNVGQPPQVAPQQQPASIPVAQIKPASSAPNPGFWISAAVFALLLLLSSLVLGDDVKSPTAVSSRLDRVLRGRSDTPALSVRS